MKALILSAGFGTRLLPFTKKKPKPLFPIAGKPVIELIIKKLENAGCREIIINTHHLHEQINNFINSKNWNIPVHTKFEHKILDTGGAIKNVSNFWDDKPFIVINSDIVTDIDLKQVYDFHLNHNYPVTLIMHDYPAFNNVSVYKNEFVTRFHENQHNDADTIKMAFTGIQVLDPCVLKHIPDNTFFSSIDLYKNLIQKNYKIKAFIASQNYWQDIGTPNQYKQAVFDHAIPQAFQNAFNNYSQNFSINKLKGDGSDRTWYRVTSSDNSMIMVDHGISDNDIASEANSFIKIGKHLYSKGIIVPKIYFQDNFSGIVIMEDLGDMHLQTFISNRSYDEILKSYQKIIDMIIKQSISAKQEFDLKWAYQTSYYDYDMIIEKECLYFTQAFLNQYLKLNIKFSDLENDFKYLAKQAVDNSIIGFMHRDMQSRNIMVKNEDFFFIDFQAGRLGPIQYDIASLLIDPYVKLTDKIQNQLIDYCFEKFCLQQPVNKKKFYQGYKYCCLTRNLQMLGAFGYLSQVKQKKIFETYIPAALNTLKSNLNKTDDKNLSNLKKIVSNITL